MLDLVAGHRTENPPPPTMIDGLGRLRLELHRLESAMSISDEDQDAEGLLEALVGLAASAVAMAEEFVLPAVERGGEG